MKNIQYCWIAAILLGITLSSCTKEEDPPADPAKMQIENSLESGIWKITLFEDSGKNETSHFSGYDFTFESDGTLTAENGMDVVQGTWSITDSNSDDDSRDDLDFNIYFNVTNDFEELNEDWDIITETDLKLELMHISGGNGGTDYLTFEKK